MSTKASKTTPLFVPTTDRIIKLSKLFPKTIQHLESILDKPTIVYIDFANVIGWTSRLKWRVSVKRTKQLLDSFPNIKTVRFYYGTLVGDINSQTILADAKKHNYDVNTKDVKIKRLSIDVTSISMQSLNLLKSFIRHSLLLKLTISDIEYLNKRLKNLNDTGILYIEDRKCNFDVEIGMHMLEDSRGTVGNFVLWTGDCDFEYPTRRLIQQKKRVIVFGTRGQISTELGQSGATIYEVRALKNFICFAKEIDVAI